MALHLLLFSPDAKAALVLGHVLSELDVEVEFSSEIFAAVEKVTRISFDAIIVDCTNDVEAAFLLKTAKELKNNRGSLTLAIMPPDVPVNNGLQAGAHGILRKPIIPAEARETLRTVCDLIKSKRQGIPASLPSNVVPLVRPAAQARVFPRRADDPQKIEVLALAAEPVPEATSPADKSIAAPVAQSVPGPVMPSLMQASSLDEADKIRAIFHSLALRPERRKRDWKIARPLLWASASLVAASAIYFFVPVAAIGGRLTQIAASLVESRDNAVQMAARYSPPAPVLAHPKKAPAKRQIEIDDSPVAEAPVHPENIQVTPIYPVALPGTQVAKDPEPVAEQTPEPEAQTPAPAPTLSRATLNEDEEPAVVTRSRMDVPASLRTSNTSVAPPPSGPASTHAYSALLQPVVLSEEVARKFLVSDTRPAYPEEALRAGVQGAVVLQAWIAKDGTIQNLKLVRGYFVLGRAAFDAVKQWRFKPYYFNGQAVETQTFITVDFKLPSLGMKLNRGETSISSLVSGPSKP
jgi:periplasmic protein TonB